MEYNMRPTLRPHIPLLHQGLLRQQPHSGRRPRKRGGGEPLLPLWRAHGRQPQHRPAALQVHRKGAGPHPRPQLVRPRCPSLRPRDGKMECNGCLGREILQR